MASLENSITKTLTGFIPTTCQSFATNHTFPKQIYKPDSVLPESRDYHLSCPAVTSRIFAVLPSPLELQEDLGTTLHRGKDLAVSPTKRAFAPRGYAFDCSKAPMLLSSHGVSARTSRLTAYGGYPLPLPLAYAVAQCPDFPRSRPLSGLGRAIIQSVLERNG